MNSLLINNIVRDKINFLIPNEMYNTKKYNIIFELTNAGPE